LHQDHRRNRKEQVEKIQNKGRGKTYTEMKYCTHVLQTILLTFLITQWASFSLRMISSDISIAFLNTKHIKNVSNEHLDVQDNYKSKAPPPPISSHS